MGGWGPEVLYGLPRHLRASEPASLGIRLPGSTDANRGARRAFVRFVSAPICRCMRFANRWRSMQICARNYSMADPDSGPA